MALDEAGRILAAGWTIGIFETVEWVEREAGAGSILFVDAPLIVENESGRRLVTGVGWTGTPSDRVCASMDGGCL